MASARAVRHLLAVVLIAMVSACGSMQPMGGEDMVKYTVNKGETLYSISWRYGYDHREVAAWNSIPPPYNIYPGQVLYIISPHQRHARAPRSLPARSTATEAAGSSNSTTSANVVARPATVATAPTGGVVKAPPPTARPSTSVASSPARVENGGQNRNTKGVEWHWPTEGTIIAGFSPGEGKKGLDIRGQLGQEVVAAAEGNVVYSGSGLIGYGNLVIIKHSDTYLSAYGHNQRLLVKEGATVKQGEKIAEMGDSGKDGVILHFEIRRDGKPVNPLTYLPRRR